MRVGRLGRYIDQKQRKKRPAFAKKERVTRMDLPAGVFEKQPDDQGFRGMIAKAMEGSLT